jgi:transposase
VWHMLSTDADYTDLGPDNFLAHADRSRQTRRLVTQLQHLGYQYAWTRQHDDGSFSTHG